MSNIMSNIMGLVPSSTICLDGLLEIRKILFSECCNFPFRSSVNRGEARRVRRASRKSVQNAIEKLYRNVRQRIRKLTDMQDSSQTDAYGKGLYFQIDGLMGLFTSRPQEEIHEELIAFDAHLTRSHHQIGRLRLPDR